MTAWVPRLPPRPRTGLTTQPPPPQHTLFVFCFCNELFFVCLYLNAFYTTPLLGGNQSLVASLTSLLQHPDRIEFAWHHPQLTKLAVKWLRSVTWPQVVAVLTGPICFAKQVINVVQFWKASKIVSSGSRRRRWTAG